jgi:competence protein ComEA
MKSFSLAAVLAATSFAAFSFAQAPLPAGPGKDLFEKTCTTCHGTEPVTIMTDTKEGWGDTVDDMIAKGAEINAADKATIVAYLAAAFPKPINVNTATAKDIASGLDLSAKDADAVVEYRTKNGNFKTLDDVKKVPGIDAAKLEAKKKAVAFQ